MEISKKKIVSDLLLNMIATAVPIAILQLLIYPLISRNISGSGYGMMVTAVSMLTVISNTLGNTLNNIRLLNDGKYNKENIQGDFNRILFGEVCLSFIVVSICGIIMFNEMTKAEVFLISLIGILLVLHAYFTVSFRVKLDYKAIVWNNVQLGIGYIVGYLFFLKTGKWEFVYLLGYGFSLIYIFRKSTLWKEPVKKTIFWKETLQDTGLLLLSGIMYSLLNYSDKILIYPMIGAEAVTIYYIATLFGKLVSMVVGPINSVMLSYIAKLEKITKKFINLMFVFSVGIAVIGYAACLTIGKIILKYLYPQYLDEVIKYLHITSATAMIMMLISVLYPFVLKFCKMKWQVVIDMTALIFYVGLGTVLYQFWELYGFCIGVLIAFFIKLLVMYIIFKKGQYLNKKIEECETE